MVLKNLIASQLWQRIAYFFWSILEVIQRNKIRMLHMEDEYIRQRRNLMILATLLLFLEIVGVSPESISLLGINFEESNSPEYIKPMLFTVFGFVLIGYVQCLYYQGWRLVKVGYQEEVDKCIDKICLKEVLRIQRAEATRINDEHYYDIDMAYLLSMEKYSRPTISEFLRNKKQLEITMNLYAGHSMIKSNNISVTAITKPYVYWRLIAKNSLITGFCRPESYTHIWPLSYALFVFGYTFDSMLAQLLNQ